MNPDARETATKPAAGASIKREFSREKPTLMWVEFPPFGERLFRFDEAGGRWDYLD